MNIKIFTQIIEKYFIKSFAYNIFHFSSYTSTSFLIRISLCFINYYFNLFSIFHINAF